MVARAKIRKLLLVSWGFTLMGLFNILVLCVIASFLAMRFIGPESFVVILMPAIAFMLAMSLGGEIIVNFIFDAQAPDPIHDKKLIDAFQVAASRWRWLVRPRCWVLSIHGIPNAMAYGPGIPGLSATGFSRELVEMLDPDELEDVIGHELAHVKHLDTGILAIVSLLLGLINKLHTALKARTTAMMQSPPTFLVVWIIYAIGQIALCVSRFSISQERELAADATSAYRAGRVQPLISGLRKLHAWRVKKDTEEKDAKKESHRPLFEDLMVAHPGLEHRIASLEALEESKSLEGVLS